MSVTDKIIVVCGPTASGKSAIAVKLAEENNAVIINADSMQVYSDLAILSARPSNEDEEQHPHKLYGFMEASEECSAGIWLKLAVAEIKQAWLSGKTPIIVGGTGLYIDALIKGLADIPPISNEIQSDSRELLSRIGVAEFYQQLLRIDKDIEGKIDAQNPVRLLRAFDVFMQTGVSISKWQSERTIPPFPDAEFSIMKVIPEREVLYANCDARFIQMIDNGAIEEVADFLGRIPNDQDILLNNRGVYKTIGLKEIAEYLRGNTSLDVATSQAQQATRNYAKRQLTWFRKE